MNNAIFTKVSIFRNLKEFKFSHKLTEENKQAITEKLQIALKDKLELINLNSLDEKTLQFLQTNNLITSKNPNIFVDKNATLAVNMFDAEHLTIISTGDGYNLDAIKRAKDIADYLANKINFAYSDQYGYLMSDLNKIGAGLRLQCDISLNAIQQMGKIDQVCQNVAKLGYSLKQTKYKGIFSLTTNCNLGIKEEKIIDDFVGTLNQLQQLEIESEKMLDVSNHDELVDKTQRSLAILNSAYLMNNDELFALITNVRIGVNLGLIDLKPEVLIKLQKLAFSSGKEFISQTELKELAQKVQKVLKGE